MADDTFQGFPTLAPAPPPPAPTGWLMPGLKSGAYGAEADLGAALSAIGRATGFSGLAERAKAGQQYWQKAAQEAQNPELEQNPWSLKGVGYRVAQAIPSLAGMALAGAATGGLADEALVGSKLAQFGAKVPSWLGGGAGMAEGAAAKAGQQWAAGTIGGGVAGYPLAVGGMYGRAMEHGEDTQGNALKALAMGVPAAAIGAVAPTQLRGLAETGLSGSTIKRALTGGAEMAAAGGINAGVQEALGQQFDPEQSFADRAKKIVQATLMGGVVGGVIGGVTGAVRSRKPEAAEPAPPMPQEMKAPTGLPAPESQDVVMPWHTPEATPFDPNEPVPSGPAIIPEPTRPFQNTSPAELLQRHTELMGKGEAITPPELFQLNKIREEMQARTGKPTEPEPPPSTWQTPEAVPLEPIPSGEPIPMPGKVEKFENSTWKTPEATPLEPIPSGEPIPMAKPGVEPSSIAPPEAPKPVEGPVPAPVAPPMAKPQEAPDAVQEPGTAAPVLGKDAQAGGGVAVGNPQGNAVAQAPALTGQAAAKARKAAAGKIDLKDFSAKPGEPTPAQAAAFNNVPDAKLVHVEPTTGTAMYRVPDPSKPGGFDYKAVTTEGLPFSLAPKPGRNSNLLMHMQNVRDQLTKTDVADVFQSPGMKDAGARVTKLTPVQTEGINSLPASVLMHVDPTYGVALVRTIDPATGKLGYNTVSPRGVISTVGGARSALGAHMSEMVRRLEAEDQAAYKANPHGPFADPALAATRLYSSPSADAKAAQFARSVLDRVGYSGKLMFVDPRDASALGAQMNGPFRRVAEATGIDRGLAIPIRSDVRAISIHPELDPVSYMATLGHEIGHIVSQHLFDSAPQMIKDAVHGDYLRYKSAASAGTVRDVVALRKPFGSREDILASVPKFITDRKTAEAFSSVTDQKYWLGKEEWFADSVAKWLQASQKPQTLVEKFFSSVAQKLKEVWGYVTGKDPTEKANSQALHDWLDQMWDSNASASKEEKIPYRSAETLTMTNGEPAPAGTEVARGSIPDMERKLPDAMGLVDKAASRLREAYDNFSRDPQTFAQKARSFGLGWMWQQELKLRFDPMFNGAIGAIERAHELGGHATDRFMQMFNPVKAAFEGLQKQSPAAARAYDQLRANANIFGFDFGKWAQEQPDAPIFHGLDGKQLADAQAFVDAQKRSWDGIASVAGTADKMQRGLAQAAQFTNINLMLEAAYRSKYKEHELPTFALDPVQEVAQHPTLATDPTAVADYLRTSVTGRIADLDTLGREHAESVTQMKAREDAIKAQIKALRDGGADEETIKAATDEQVKTHNEIKSLMGAQKDIDGWISWAKGAIKAGDTVPYSTLGRDGNHFVSMRMKATPTGAIDPQALALLRQRISEAGMSDKFVLEANNENNQFYARVENAVQRQKLVEIAQELEKKGLLQEPEMDETGKKVVEHNFSAGPIDSATSEMFRGVGPKAVERLMAHLDEQYSELPKEHADVLRKQLRAAFLDLLPRNSMVRLHEPRMGVQGFSPDMSANFNRYWTQFSGAAGRMWSQPQIQAALASIAKTVDDYKHDINAQPGAVDVSAKVADEMFKRETRAPYRANWGWMRNWLAVNHTYFLGLSPAYFAELMTQIPTLLLPQLGRKYGYLDSAKAIGAASEPALQLSRALLRSSHGEDGIFTLKDLTDAGMSKENAKLAMEVALRDGLEMGGWTKVQMGEAPSVAKNRLFSRINKFTTISEVFPRALAMFAAAKLHETNPAKARASLHDFIDETVGQSMGKWQTSAQARNLGQGGAFGPIAPIVTKFMSYQTQLIGKLYREFDQAFLGFDRELAKRDVANGAKDSVESLAKLYRMESRRFLAGHLGAVTALSGSLGLPILPVLASAASSVGNFFTGDDRFDAETSYRGFLRDTFGDGLADVLAKGLPRAIGMDLSEHASEANLLPFSDMLTDKRRWSDVFNSSAFRAMGSPVSMASNFIQGATDIANGHVLPGMQKTMPSSLKNAVRVFRMSQYGYEDDHGVKLPIPDPSAYDMMLQSVGITPTAKARDQELTEALRGAEDRRQIATGNLETNLSTAYAHNDRQAFSSALNAIMAYNNNHPTNMIQPGAVLGKTMSKEMRGSAFGANMFSPRDMEHWRILNAYGSAKTSYGM